MLRLLFGLVVVLGSSAVCAVCAPDGGSQKKPSIALPARPPAPEMKVLAKMVGTWDTFSTNKVSEWNPKETRSQGKATAKLILAGQFLLCQNSADQPEPYGITIYTYDSRKKEYRSWIFDALGNAVEASGQWDPSTQTLTFTPAGRPGAHHFTFRFPDHRTIEYTIVGRDESGKLLIDVTGEWVRQAKEAYDQPNNDSN